MAFEQLVAEAAAKKETKKKDKKSSKADSTHAHSSAEKIAADAPNVPRA
jgi:hypothetical protein